MRAKRDNDALLISLNDLEGQLLHQVFRQLEAQYRLKPEDLDGATSQAWYSTRGSESALTTSDDVRDWVEHLHAFKAARLGNIEDWCRQLELGIGKRLRLRVRLEDVLAFVGAINDHRLIVAARHEAGEEAMSLRTPEELVAQPEPRQEALLEIHFLAWIIEETLREMDGL